ncbi:MAG: glycosyltransferase [Fibrobacter sp.]|nr:glycosyltransferase [Fibrobacter sp.]
MAKEKNFISAVVYVRNDDAHISEFLSMLTGVLEGNFEHSEIICVNDFSSDDSLAKIREFCKAGSSVSISVLNMSYFHGIELSMNAGVDLSIGDFVFEFDSVAMDYEPSRIMDLYYRTQEGFDIVSLTPDKGNGFFSRVFYKLFNVFSNYPQKISTETVRILSRRTINRVSSMSKTIPYRKAIYASSGLRTARIVYQRMDSSRSVDKGERSYRRGLAINSLILFTDVGYKFSIYMAVIMMCIAISMVTYSVVIYLTRNPVEGWTTTILFLSFAFFGLFSVLTVIIKYLQIIVDLIFKRKTYNFESIEKLT